MIALNSVTKRFRGQEPQEVFGDIDLSIDAGEVVLVSGPTGAGKSTLLKLLYAAEFADRGRVTLFGRDPARLRRSSIALLRRHIGVVPQSFALLRNLTALRNVALALEVRAEPQRDVLMRAAEALSAVGLADHLDTLVSRLSDGQRQLVAIARALVGEPLLLIADEPTAHLDGIGREMFIDALIDVQSRGGAAVIATNDHALLCAGARCSWRHMALDGGALSMIADRQATLIDDLVAQSGEFPIPDIPSNKTPSDQDLDHSVDEWEDSIDTNVVPFPVAASAGGMS
ncbi:cell division ATP-binding protein FtsE [Haliangium ochraceum]|uniref:ABC transporter related protein n=1 Tax=Haliangium ochraceum (strain DSM 14365 / JCM 11303 / SMP-2) TaxID=502025 RepID=D0LZI5_HALO1|nr:ATP-binding cassette domain-containing protein [Haliangium ochraceum]ACY17964.1 ABC transporter related protein [Haliangium ochraceum DSM 14365]